MIDAIVVVGGGLKKDKNGWRTTNFDEGDDFGIIGDRLRVVAGSFIFKENSDSLVIALGGKGQLAKIGGPEVSEILKKELIGLGIPPAKIIEDGESGNTYQQLKELQRILAKRKIKNAAVISNKHHLPRIKAMIECGQELVGLKNMLSRGDIGLLSAESVLLKYDKKNWGKIIAESYQGKAMKDRIKLEQRGVAQIKLGTYKLN